MIRITQTLGGGKMSRTLQINLADDDNDENLELDIFLITSKGQINYNKGKYFLAEKKFKKANNFYCQLPKNAINIGWQGQNRWYWVKALSALNKSNSSEFIGLVKTIKKNDEYSGIRLFLISLGRIGNHFDDWLTKREFNKPKFTHRY